ncbi:hypothetical protein [Marinobacterium rhizophilum]|uniref:hypothetical protein n=1 Tax=Marinobacterium rhizophilum TaxID=420402 RepID=UPI0012EBFCCF|nr:hypothetical protein [Marinobacterium rhizophilum]
MSKIKGSALNQKPASDHAGPSTPAPSPPGSTLIPSVPRAHTPVDLPPPTPAKLPGVLSGQLVPLHNPSSPMAIIEGLTLIIDQAGRVCCIIPEGLHRRAEPVKSTRGVNFLRTVAVRQGLQLRRNGLNELVEDIVAYGEESAPRLPVYHRVAPVSGGIELYLGDQQFTRVRVTAGNVEILENPSEVLFCPSPISSALPVPAENGSDKALRAILNVSDLDYQFILAWVTYTMAHPKVNGSKYVFLVVSGDQGTGKSFLTRVLSLLVDPNRVGIQAFPSKAEDLALFMGSSHVVCIDNMRSIKSQMSDLLCMASTGGTVSTRALYTDGALSTKNLHGACIFNGIHSLVAQSDLAQRCLTIRLSRIDGAKYRSESEMMELFEQHHPEIFRYLLNLISKIFNHLPSVEPANPERMIDFCRWLAAFEAAENLPAGVLQLAYSESLRQSQLDTLMDNTLAAAIIEFAVKRIRGQWTGSPADFLNELNAMVSQGTVYSREWPKNPTALGRRLPGLKASLATQGIHIESTRGKARQITIRIDQNQAEEVFDEANIF